MAYERPILLVDDDPTLLKILSETLRVVGVNSICVTDAREALKKVDQEPIDIVITDVSMPGMDGFELLYALKAKEAVLNRSILVFIVTAYSDSAKAVRALRDGAFCYVSKPVSSQALLLHLRRAINRLAPGSGDSIDIKALSPRDASRSGKESPRPRSTPSAAGGPQAYGGKSLLQVPLTADSVSNLAPPQSGIVILNGDQGECILVEWAQDIRSHLGSYLPHGASPARPAASKAKYFEYFLTKVPSMVAQFFDKIVNETGKFPVCQPDAPQGSKYFGQTVRTKDVCDQSDDVITSYRPHRDTGLVEQVRGMVEASPDCVELQEWYAFLLYGDGQLEEAAKCYENLMQTGHRRAENSFYLGNTYYKLNRIPEAVKAWQLAVESSPTSKMGRKAALRIRKIQETAGV